MSAIAVLLTDQFADWECALLSAVARTHLHCGLTIATPNGLPVTSMGGLHVTPHARLDDVSPAETDALVVCGGMSWESPASPDISTALMRFSSADRIVAGICAGTVPLAKAGLLDARHHTSNSAETLARTGYGGASFYRDQPDACRDGKVITAAGTAPLSFTAHVLEALGFESPDLGGFLALFTREAGTARFTELRE